jgi:hypothetical protein
MAFISLPGITCGGNPYSQRVCPSPVFLCLVQRDFSLLPGFLRRLRLHASVSEPARAPPDTSNKQQSEENLYYIGVSNSCPLSRRSGISCVRILSGRKWPTR